jgi:hypothetical protein
MLASAIRPLPPSLPPPRLRNAARSAGILALAMALVVLTTLALSRVLVPRPTDPVVDLPPPALELDLGATPTRIGGQLTVTGDFEGAMTLATARSAPGYEPSPDVAGGLAYVRGDVIVRGPEGDLVFSPRTGEITRIEYDGMSFYLDPGDCVTTPGGRSDELGLLHVRVNCPEIADLRGAGAIGLEGVIAVPADALGDRGPLPATGGSVEYGGLAVEIVMGVGLVGGIAPMDNERVPILAPADAFTGLGILYDPQDGSYELTGIQLDGTFTELAQPCPLTSEGVGRLNPETAVVRVTIDCADVAAPDGTTAALTGDIVVDLVQLGDAP